MLASFSQGIAHLLAIESADFSKELVQALRSAVFFDDASVIVYQDGKQPIIDYNYPILPVEKSSIHFFVAGAYLLDPFYRQARKSKTNSFLRLSELAPDGFRQSEYYKQYYRYTHLQDEVGYLIHINKRCFVNISLSRTKPNGRFSRKQLSFFSDVLPIVAQLTINHYQKLDNVQAHSGELQAQLEQALNSFGSSLLTNRESQVVQLLLHGHSTKSVARVLDISPETVKLYRKNCYSKLKVTSQGELFYLFVDSLIKLKDYQGGDPLHHYFKS